MERLRREAGVIITYEGEGCDGKPLCEVMMVQCVHCGCQIPVGKFTPLSLAHHKQNQRAKQMGFCSRCNGFTCGARCEQCVPLEQYLDNIENKISNSYRPTRIFVPPSYGGKREVKHVSAV